MFSEDTTARTFGVPESIINLIYPSIPKILNEEYKEIYHPFRLPITYLDNNRVHSIQNTVINDLELDTTIYNHVFQPKNEFSENLMKEWRKHITNDITFLEESQRVIKDMKEFDDTNVDTKSLMNIWDDTKNNKSFLDKYYYMDWEQFKYLNKSASFLQILSVANVLSPLISLLIPIIFMIIPFLILKIRGIPLTFEMYINVLKDTAKHHFIGKTILNIENISWDKVIYIVMTFGLYLLQIYQNMNICSRFYKNLKTINKNLIDIRLYIDKITYDMELFVNLHQLKDTYKDFCSDVNKHFTVLRKFSKELSKINEFKHNLSQSSECGYLLKCYYDLQNDEIYDSSLRFSIRFCGYIGNLKGVYENMISQKMSCAKFNIKSNSYVSFKGQYYPPFKDMDNVVTNDVKLKTNIIITGPNASGKTTLLKTTAINIIITQQLGCGFYNKCELNPYTHIHSYLNIPDTSERDSLFQAESRRCKEILDHINENDNESRHFCIFDELYSGTNPIEATKAAHAFLSYMCKYKNVEFMLTTHYIEICERFKVSSLAYKHEKEESQQIKQITNYKMDAIEVDGKIKYTYKMSKGVSHVQGAIRVFEEMGYPEEIMDSFRMK